LIWFAPWNYTKVLFLLTRYLPFGGICCVYYYEFCPDASIEACSLTFNAAAWFVLIGITIAEIVLSVRTWAIWHRDRRVGTGLAVAFISCLIPNCYFMNQFLKSVEWGPPSPLYTGCFVVSVKPTVFVNWLMLVIVEAAVMVLMTISAFRTYKSWNDSELIYTIHKQGILFCVYLLCLTICNVVLVFIGYTSVLAQTEYILHSLLTARIIFNIRTLGGAGAGETILHAEHYEETLGPHLAFARHSVISSQTRDEFNCNGS